jgi:hypothetical protein
MARHLCNSPSIVAPKCHSSVHIISYTDHNLSHQDGDVLILFSERKRKEIPLSRCRPGRVPSRHFLALDSGTVVDPSDQRNL